MIFKCSSCDQESLKKYYNFNGDLLCKFCSKVQSLNNIKANAKFDSISLNFPLPEK